MLRKLHDLAATQRDAPQSYNNTPQNTPANNITHDSSTRGIKCY